jgi:prepilin-type processing-associated H-X9-DG protein
MRDTADFEPRHAVTIVELLVVVAIIGLSVGLLLAGVQKMRAAAHMTECKNNIRQIAVALHQFHDKEKRLPQGISIRDSSQPFLSWNARILPFLEQEVLWQLTLRAFAQDTDFRNVPPHAHRAHVIPQFSCPADDRTSVPSTRLLNGFPVSFTAYLGVWGNDYARPTGVLFADSCVRFCDVTDGMSNTLLVGERPPSPDERLGWWYAGWGQNKTGSAEMLLGVEELNSLSGYEACPSGPYRFTEGRVNDRCDAFHYWSLHSGGAHFAFCDGSVRFLPYSAGLVLPALATRAGGEAASID